MIRINDITTALSGLVGIGSPGTSGLDVLNAHPLLTAENIEAITPSEDNGNTTKADEWLQGQQTAAIVQVVQRFCADKQTWRQSRDILQRKPFFDGAGRIKKFFSITFPFLTPVIFYSIITQTGLALQEFNAPFIITQGGPRNSTTLISVLIYNTAFQQKDMGLACALTWFFLIIVSVITAALFISQKYWVYYNGDFQEEK